MFVRILIVIASLLIGAGVAWALWPRPVEVETARVERGSFDVVVEEEGQSRIREVFTVSAPVTRHAASS